MLLITAPEKTVNDFSLTVLLFFFHRIQAITVIEFARMENMGLKDSTQLDSFVF